MAFVRAVLAVRIRCRGTRAQAANAKALTHTATTFRRCIPSPLCRVQIGTSWAARWAD